MPEWLSMEKDVLSLGLAAWGAVLATVLAGIRIVEALPERLRLTTTYAFANPEEGNQIFIENSSSTPLMISYWELYWCRRRWFRKIVTGGAWPDAGNAHITVAEHSRATLDFRDEQWFDWGRSKRGDAKLYLTLHIVRRRKPFVLKVYPSE